MPRTCRGCRFELETSYFSPASSILTQIWSMISWKPGVETFVCCARAVDCVESLCSSFRILCVSNMPGAFFETAFASVANPELHTNMRQSWLMR